MLTTKAKIRIATTLSRIFRGARSVLGNDGDTISARRGQINWRLDLKEGIDFAIFLGLYERSTTKVIRQIVQPGQITLDVGANIGTHTFELARKVGLAGKVYAFEPTAFAYEKLMLNLRLNADLIPIVQAEQLMLAASDDKIAEDHIHSSWPLMKTDGLHTEHLGRLRSTAGARAITLDTYLKESAVRRVDFIKLDVDGFECEVLEGAQHCLDAFHPVILMELAPYILRERGSSLEHLVAILTRAGYRFLSLDGEELGTDAAKFNRQIPNGSSMNVLARVTS